MRARVPDTIAPLPLLRSPLKELNRCGDTFAPVPGNSTWVSILFLFTAPGGFGRSSGTTHSVDATIVTRVVDPGTGLTPRANLRWCAARASERVAPKALARAGFARSDPRSAPKSVPTDGRLGLLNAPLLTLFVARFLECL